MGKTSLKVAPEVLQLLLAERFFKVRVEFDALALQSMRKEQFYRQSGFVEAVALEVVDGELHQVPDCPVLGILLKCHFVRVFFTRVRGVDFFAFGFLFAGESLFDEDFALDFAVGSSFVVDCRASSSCFIFSFENVFFTSR
jgi:hypothetical protein